MDLCQDNLSQDSKEQKKSLWNVKAIAARKGSFAGIHPSFVQGILSKHCMNTLLSQQHSAYKEFFKRIKLKETFFKKMAQSQREHKFCSRLVVPQILWKRDTQHISHSTQYQDGQLCCHVVDDGEEMHFLNTSLNGGNC